MAEISANVVGVYTARTSFGGVNFQCLAYHLDTVFSSGNTYKSNTIGPVTFEGSLFSAKIPNNNWIGAFPVNSDKQYDPTNKLFVQRLAENSMSYGYNTTIASTVSGNSDYQLFWARLYVDNNGKLIFSIRSTGFTNSENPELNYNLTVVLPALGRFGYFTYDRDTTFLSAASYNESYSDYLQGAFRLTPRSTDPYDDVDGQSDIAGGATGGSSGGVSIPNFPGLTATDTGVIGLFAPSAAQMRALADYMWTDFGGQGQDVVGVLSEIVDAIKRSISNPLDYIIGLNIIPSQGLSVGSSTSIKFGFTNSGVSMPRLSNQYFTVDCGTITFSPVCGDTFLDYAPYSKFSIYLPYIGTKDLDANDCVGHTIGVVYHGDVVTGGLTAYITKDGKVVYQFSGCCALSIPLSADGWGSTISGAIQIATQLVTASAGGSAGVIKEAAKDAASVAANPSLLSPTVQHSGAISGGAGAMGVQKPYIIREAVRYHSTYNFNSVTGYPSHYYKQISELSGYTIMYDIHLHNISATDDELSEIEGLLKMGVIL